MGISCQDQVDLLIKNGTIATEYATFRANLAISQGKIVGVFDDKLPITANAIIDAQGKWILPGIIDVHTHFRHMGDHVDDLGDVTRSAAFGGVTTIISFISFDTKIPVVEGISKFIEDHKSDCFTDFSFHLRLFPEPEFIKQVSSAIDLGINSFKISLGYKKKGLVFPDDLIFMAMEEIRDNRGLIMVHSENGAIIELLENRLCEEMPDDPMIFSLSRPPYTEVEAISRICNLARATKCPIYIVHLSTAAGLAEIKKVKKPGFEIYVETCPHYLLLDNQILKAKKGLAKIAPPLRSSYDNQALWDAVKAGLIDTVGTDHVAYHSSDKRDLMSAPFGAPGVENLLNLMLSEGVFKRKISLTRLVQLLSTNPAKIFGLYPKKGTIQPGSDADLVIIDPDAEHVIQAKTQHTNADYSLFEGWKIKGKPIMSILRGQILLQDGALMQKSGFGKFISRFQLPLHN